MKGEAEDENWPPRDAVKDRMLCVVIVPSGVGGERAKRRLSGRADSEAALTVQTTSERRSAKVSAARLGWLGCLIEAAF